MNNGKLRMARNSRGINQYQLALKTGIYQSQISLIENGLKIPTPDQKKRIAKAFGYELKDLWPASDQKNEN